MADGVNRCARCGKEIAPGVAVYGDNNRRFCSETCARAQIDRDQGVGHAHAFSDFLAADRVGPSGGPAQSRKRSPTSR